MSRKKSICRTQDEKTYLLDSYSRLVDIDLFLYGFSNYTDVS